MTDWKIKKKQAVQAIKTLKLLVGKFLEDPSKKKPLLEDETDRSLFLQITVKKIPPSKNYQMIKVPLPHSLITDSTNVCLITGDLDKRNRKAEIDPVILHYKEILKKNDITEISEVIPLRQLRTEYKSYESKRYLLGAFDVFLADNVIAGCLPKVLGKSFFKKRKFPIQINIKTKNLKEQVEKALSQTVFFFTSRGNSCASEVAYLHMNDKEILENIIASVEILSEKIPGGFDNILGMYIKTAKSKAIPIYMSFANPNDVVLEQVRHEEEVEVAELSTLPDVNVRVFRDGRVKIEKTSEVISNDNEMEHKPEPPFKMKKDSDLLNNEKFSESHIKEELNIVENNIALGEKCSLSSKRRQKRKRNCSQDADESMKNMEASVVLPQGEHNENEMPSSKKQGIKSKINRNEKEETNSSELNRIQSNKVLIEETDKIHSTKGLKKKLSKKKHLTHNEPGENVNAKSGRKGQVDKNLLRHQKTKVCKMENILTCDVSIKVRQKRK